ncbi:unnamed protein product [Pedinophyceae sp. YPF-701]|nr:unnamed protein product [Pedinophyceae sp. YPF-701]
MEEQFIVRFNGYTSHDELRERLTGVLGPETAPPPSHGSLDAGERSPRTSWAWVERPGPKHVPTDFAVITAPRTTTRALSSRLSAAPGFRSVHLDSRMTRKLNWVLRDPVTGRAERYAGRKRTAFSWEDPAAMADAARLRGGRKMLRTAANTKVTLRMGASALWAKGFKGKGIKMGVFDTAFRGDHPHLKNIKERTNWTTDKSADDGLGHGTFVAGVVASSDSSCPGFAPEVDLYAFKVFTDDQVSFTSWFMDSFNYAIYLKLHVVNLSIGGPDYMDLPFTDKVNEVTAAGITMVSAIGNDGDLWGTMNNPADQNNVIGVGGVDWNDDLAGFSSRGMTVWELPEGYGRMKPDVVAYGSGVMGSAIEGGCRGLSGTSVAAPVAAGALCLVASTVPEAQRAAVLNPGALKQALVEGARRLDSWTVHEVGQGVVDLEMSAAILKDYKPRASLQPASLKLTEPQMWPYSRTSPFYGRSPVVVNATILNGMAVTGTVVDGPTFTPTDAGGEHLDVRFEHSERLWPWSGYLAVFIAVKASGKDYTGTARGTIAFTVRSPPGPGGTAMQESEVEVPLEVHVKVPPPREKRVLFDVYHSVKYPPAYIPRDALDDTFELLDWHGDHPHTNFKALFDTLQSEGFEVEQLTSPATCVDLSQYGALILADTEGEFLEGEVEAVEAAVRAGLGLVVLGEWYNLDKIREAKFFDDNTRSSWDAATGGANVPALNELLKPFGLAFGDTVLDGTIHIDGTTRIRSGAPVAKAPAGTVVFEAEGLAKTPGTAPLPSVAEMTVLSMTDVGQGRVVLYADTSSVDGDYRALDGMGLVVKMIKEAVGSDTGLAARGRKIASDMGAHEVVIARPPEPELPASLLENWKKDLQRNFCHRSSGWSFQPAGEDGAATAAVEARSGSATLAAVNGSASDGGIEEVDGTAPPAASDGNTTAATGSETVAADVATAPAGDVTAEEAGAMAGNATAEEPGAMEGAAGTLPADAGAANVTETESALASGTEAPETTIATTTEPATTTPQGTTAAPATTALPETTAAPATTALPKTTAAPATTPQVQAHATAGPVSSSSGQAASGSDEWGAALSSANSGAAASSFAWMSQKGAPGFNVTQIVVLLGAVGILVVVVRALRVRRGYRSVPRGEDDGSTVRLRSGVEGGGRRRHAP